MKTPTSLVALTVAIAAFAWTAAGETSDPVLTARELPLDIVGDCAQQVSCHSEKEFLSRWIGRTDRGDLFLVSSPACAEVIGCRAWLGEKTAHGAATLLAVAGEFRFQRGGGAYPTILQRTEISATHSAYSSFEWTGAKYTRTENRMVYRVDGVECGTQSECGNAAREALRQERVERAVKIWESVQGVSWI